MTSRKKNKGKERKAKKLESDRTRKHREWTGWALGIHWKDGSVVHPCNHGCEFTIPNDDHPVTKFIDAIYVNIFNEVSIYSGHLHNALQSYPQVWKNDVYRNMVINIMTRIGTNMAIEFSTTVGSAQHMRQTGSKVLAISIMIIEKFDGDIDYAICRQAVAKKIRDFHVICLKFYRKRATCKCLKDVHLESRKALPKHARCDHCEVVKERRLLMVCSRCRIDQYCSRKCQVEGWDKHKRDCKIRVSVCLPVEQICKNCTCCEKNLFLPHGCGNDGI